MALSPRLEVRQSQSLTLTPQLMQSIRLLQLSHLELDAFVDAELLRNPLLEREDGADPAEPPRSHPRTRELRRHRHPGRAHPGRRPDRRHLRHRRRERLSRAAQRRSPQPTGAAAAAAAMAPRRPTSTSSSRHAPTLAEHLEAQIGLLIERSGRAAHRALPDRRAQRAGLPRARARDRRRPARRSLGASSKRCWKSCSRSSPPASSPATCANASRCSCASATGSIR